MVPDEPTAPIDADEGTAVEFDGERASEAVISAVASEVDTDPVRLTPLYRSLDPDALDAMVEHARRSATANERTQWISFRYEGYDVHVCADGRVYLQPDE